MGDMKGDRGEAEQEAVRTTIVGGRPPGSGRRNGAIPRGIEVLVKKAAVDAEFRTLLIERRADAAKDIGLTLDPAEAMMLRTVPQAQLEAYIARTMVDPKRPPAFLGRAAAVMLAALGAAVATGCGPLDRGEPAGIRPDGARETATVVAAPQETAETPGDATPDAKETPEPAANVTPVETPRIHIVAGVMPVLPEPTPPPVTKGIRPDRPDDTVTRGIRPDRPQ